MAKFFLENKNKIQDIYRTKILPTTKNKTSLNNLTNEWGEIIFKNLSVMPVYIMSKWLGIIDGSLWNYLNNVTTCSSLFNKSL
jgi:hypothetical protein